MEKYPLKGLEGYYIDRKANVYSKWVNKARHGVVLGEKCKKMKPRVQKFGYTSYSFGRKVQKNVHRLMYETFVGPIPKGMVIRHLDSDPTNNDLSNLAIGTQSDNMQDCLKAGRHKTNRMINKELALEISELRNSQRYTWQEVADIYGIKKETVRKGVKKLLEKGDK